MQAGTSGTHTDRHLTLEWAASTDVGKRRQVNEDSSGVFPGLYVIADGMGGHLAGDTASRLAIEVVERYASQVPLSLDQVASLVADANEAVHHHATTVGPEGMGTTLVGVALIDNGADPGLVVFNVGDSRCYQLRNGYLRLVTADHSLVQELVDAGKITPDEADHHPERNVVTRAIGIEDQVAADFIVLGDDAASRLVLCSDGVSGELDRSELTEAVVNGGPGEAAQGLIDAVLTHPARDNATAVVIDVTWENVREIGDLDITGPRVATSEDHDITTPRRPARRLLDVPPTSPRIAEHRPERVLPLIDAVPADTASGRSTDSESDESESVDSEPIEAEQRQPLEETT